MKIVFCHNVHVRINTLFNTVQKEKVLYPNSNSVIAYNDLDPKSFFKKFRDIEFIPYHGKTHKIGCMNGCITSMKVAVKYSPDVVIFSHDDVIINEKYLKVVEDNCKIISSGEYDVIVRKPKGGYGDNYYLMECFYMSGKAAQQCFGQLSLYKDENHISKDIRGSISPEASLYSILKIKNLKVLELEYNHTLDGYNQTLGNLMGFNHLKAGERGWIDK